MSAALASWLPLRPPRSLQVHAQGEALSSLSQIPPEQQRPSYAIGGCGVCCRPTPESKPEVDSGSTRQELDAVLATVAVPELAAARFQRLTTTNPMNACAADDSSEGNSQTTAPRGDLPGSNPRPRPRGGARTGSVLSSVTRLKAAHRCACSANSRPARRPHHPLAEQMHDALTSFEQGPVLVGVHPPDLIPGFLPCRRTHCFGEAGRPISAP